MPVQFFIGLQLGQVTKANFRNFDIVEFLKQNAGRNMDDLLITSGVHEQNIRIQALIIPVWCNG